MHGNVRLAEDKIPAHMHVHIDARKYLDKCEQMQDFVSGSKMKYPRRHGRKKIGRARSGTQNKQDAMDRQTGSRRVIVRVRNIPW